jgi:hypothetical protein
MLVSKLKNAAAALLVAFFLMAGAAAVISTTSAAEQSENSKAVKEPDKEKADKQAVPSISDKGEAKIKIQWEYKSLTHDKILAIEFNKQGTNTFDGGLNMLGDEGWELVAIEPAFLPPRNNIERPALYVFKRQKR